jgi:protein-S-isoprenylcysteine O-methyltransferase Ste14
VPSWNSVSAGGGLMRLVVRWAIAVSVSSAAFAVSWWVCQAAVRLDEPKTLAVAGAVLAVVLAVTAWWAAREHTGNAGVRIKQSIRARRDAFTAGRNQTVNIRRRPGE